MKQRRTQTEEKGKDEDSDNTRPRAAHVRRSSCLGYSEFDYRYVAIGTSDSIHRDRHRSPSVELHTLTTTVYIISRVHAEQLKSRLRTFREHVLPSVHLFARRANVINTVVDERINDNGKKEKVSTMASLRQTPLTCSGHTRPVVHLAFSDVTESGYYLISACKGNE